MVQSLYILCCSLCTPTLVNACASGICNWKTMYTVLIFRQIDSVSVKNHFILHNLVFVRQFGLPTTTITHFKHKTIWKCCSNLLENDMTQELPVSNCIVVLKGNKLHFCCIRSRPFHIITSPAFLHRTSEKIWNKVILKQTH